MDTKECKLSFYHGDDKRDSREIKISMRFQFRNGCSKTRLVKIDTGASTIAMPASFFGFYDEEEFCRTNNCEKNIMVGIRKDAPTVYYRYIVEKIRLGTFELMEFPVQITFNTGVESCLIGMTLLRLFNIEINNEYKTIAFKATNKTIEMLDNNSSFRDIDNEIFETYVDFSDLEAKANYLYRKLNGENLI